MCTNCCVSAAPVGSQELFSQGSSLSTPFEAMRRYTLLAPSSAGASALIAETTDEASSMLANLTYPVFDIGSVQTLTTCPYTASRSWSCDSWTSRGCTHTVRMPAAPSVRAVFVHFF